MPITALIVELHPHCPSSSTSSSAETCGFVTLLNLHRTRTATTFHGDPTLSYPLQYRTGSLSYSAADIYHTSLWRCDTSVYSREHSRMRFFKARASLTATYHNDNDQCSRGLNTFTYVHELSYASFISSRRSVMRIRSPFMLYVFVPAHVCLLEYSLGRRVTCTHTFGVNPTLGSEILFRANLVSSAAVRARCPTALGKSL